MITREELCIALRNLPEDFNWDFLSPDTCAIGLARRITGLPAAEMNGWELTKVLNFPAHVGTAIFYGSYEGYRSLVPTPEMVADAIENPEDFMAGKLFGGRGWAPSSPEC
jgi:hypothetical protein